jgi:uncharacterized protein YbjT (DUF2867 family)
MRDFPICGGVCYRDDTVDQQKNAQKPRVAAGCDIGKHVEPRGRDAPARAPILYHHHRKFLGGETRKEAIVILITGSGGTVGREVVRELAQAGKAVRAAYHSRPPTAPGVQGARIDMTSGEGLDDAMRGIEALFLLAGEVPDQVAAETRVVEAAKRAGVRRIVKLSVLAAETEAYSFARIHRAVERAIESSGIPWTFLRPGSFMQNFATYYRDMIREQNGIFLPMSDSREAHVDARDIARVAAAALTRDGHAGKAYDLVGPEPLSYADAAAKISAVAGRTIAYVPMGDDDFIIAMRGMGVPDPSIEAMLDLYRFIRQGQLPKSSPAIRDVTGREPIRFDQFARDYADAWKT